MTSAAEGGATLAWRLLATLESGSLLVVASALVAYTARSRVVRRFRKTARLPVNTVLISETTSALGRELKSKLETLGFTVDTVTENVISGATSGAGARVDAVIVIGVGTRPGTLDGITNSIIEDVYKNLKLLETLSSLLRPGGCLAWTCAGEETTSGPFSVAGVAFDAVIQANLQHIAKNSQCEPIWIGRGDGPERTVDRLIAALMPCDSSIMVLKFTVRSAALRIGEYLGRLLKITP